MASMQEDGEIKDASTTNLTKNEDIQLHKLLFHSKLLL